MRRVLALLVITAMSLPLVITAFVLVRFHLDRDRIVRELCVQRMLPEAEQTCHGQCHLKKGLRAQLAREADLPSAPRLELRIEPAVARGPEASRLVTAVKARLFGPKTSDRLLSGHSAPAEPVPWA